MQEKKELVTSYSKEEVLANEIRIYKNHIKKLNARIEETEYLIEVLRRNLEEIDRNEK